MGSNMKISIIGCGNMGRALAERLSVDNELYLYNHHAEKAEHLESKGFGKAYRNIKDAIHPSHMVILAVKPQNIAQAAESIRDSLQDHQILISLLAGTTIEALKQHFPKAQIVRMMPNLPLIHGEGVIGLSSDEKIKKTVEERLKKTFEPLGKIYWFPEEKIDALTALASSGPAFFFAMVEAMIDAGIAMGFTAADAQEITYQMLQGSLALLKDRSKHPGELKWQIASPQGTTIAGLVKLEEQAIRGGIINTFLAAYNRSKLMAQTK